MISRIKQSLLLHIPLWIALNVGFVVLSLPESMQESGLLIVFGGYFLSRYLWRKYLKKQGKLGDASSGLFSLVFWVAVGLLAIYVKVSPETPKLAIYQDGIDPAEESDSGVSLKHAAKKGLLMRAADYAMREGKAERLACGYVEQEKLFSDCDETISVELDNDPKTLEVFVISHELSECEQLNCKLWLFQMSADYLAAEKRFKTREGEEETAEQWIYQADTIANWSRVLVPVEVQTKSHFGWRTLKIKHQDNSVEDWQFSKHATP